ncbi:MAG: thioesterase [Crocinitomicaceae bacterium]|nr:thioesterase [Crocinitomicaceae bacterium]
MQEHLVRLKNMYLKAPINKLMKPTIEIFPSKAVIKMKVDPTYFHGGKSLHGCIYFKMLDDASFFAAQSIVNDYFVLTSNYNVHLFRPIFDDYLIAEGEVISMSKSIVTASSKLFNSSGKLCAAGTGAFAKSSLAIEDAEGYLD